jgi:FKBP-type peptidyl-prolyl cis-trans isomerase FkpA
MKKGLTLLFFSALVFFSCKKKSDSCNYSESNVKAPQEEIDSLENYLTTHYIDAIPHSSGIFYYIDSMGTGNKPDVCSTVTVTYQGSLLSNNYVFESRTTPVDFALGGLIIGWQKGLQAIKSGGGIVLYIPPSLGYGSSDITSGGQVIIPANSYLKFVISLRNVQ